jgi:hypothetical protein
LTHIQDGQRIQNKAVVYIEDFTILVQCGAMQFSQNLPLPLSCFCSEQEVKDGQFANKISKLATASR